MKKEEEKDDKKQILLLKTDLLTASQAAGFLGISMPKLYELTSTRSIPCYKPTGGKLYFNRTELENWVWSHRVKTATDISMEANNY